MAINDFTVLLDLQEFFSDDRRRSKVLINQNYTKIIDLEDKISEIFGIERFHLLSDGHFLPSCEDIALIRNGETICVKPTLSPLPSVLLSDIYYKNLTNSCNEIKRITDDGLSQVTLQQGTVPLEKSNHQFCNETVVSTPHDKILEYSVRNKNDHLETGFYASTPNTDNISPEYNEIHEHKELVEIHKNKKKKKHKLEKNENVSRKRKCKVLDEDKTLDADMSIENNCNFERKSKEKAKKRKTIKAIEKEFETENISLQNENDELIHSSNKEVSIKEPKTTHHKNLGEVESKINDHTKIDLKPLPHKKAREGKTWSTEPLLKTINIVKIIKTPISKIEIDYSRFDFIPNEDYTMETSLSEIKNPKTNSTATDCNSQKTNIVKQNDSECSVPSEHNAEGTASIKFHSGSKISPKKISNPDICEETNKISSTPHVTASNKNENIEVPPLLENTSSFSSDRIQLDENSQDSEYESKNKAREKWRQKINKISEDSKSLEFCSSSALYKNFVKSETLFEDKNNRLDTEIIGAIDTHKDIILEDMDRAESEETKSKKRPDSAVHTEEDSLLSFTTVTDAGNDSEPKKRRRRRHRKKNKNEISTKPCWEEYSNNFIAKNVPLVSAKPKIHVRFEDSDNEILEQKKISPEAHDVEEKIKILQNVTLTPDKLSGRGNEIHFEEKRDIEPNTDSPNHGLEMAAASSKSPSSSNFTQEECISVVLPAPIPEFFKKQIETLKQYHKDHSNSSACGENEIHVEEKRNIEPNTNSPNHGLEMAAASSESPSSSNFRQEECTSVVLQAPISKFFNEQIETLKQYHKHRSNSSTCNSKDEEEIDMALLKLKTELLKTVDAMDQSIQNRDILTGHSQSF